MPLSNRSIEFMNSINQIKEEFTIFIDNRYTVNYAIDELSRLHNLAPTVIKEILTKH